MEWIDKCNNLAVKLLKDYLLKYRTDTGEINANAVNIYEFLTVTKKSTINN